MQEKKRMDPFTIMIKMMLVVLIMTIMIMVIVVTEEYKRRCKSGSGWISLRRCTIRLQLRRCWQAH